MVDSKAEHELLFAARFQAFFWVSWEEIALRIDLHRESFAIWILEQGRLIGIVIYKRWRLFM